MTSIARREQGALGRAIHLRHIVRAIRTVLRRQVQRHRIRAHTTNSHATTQATINRHRLHLLGRVHNQVIGTRQTRVRPYSVHTTQTGVTGAQRPHTRLLVRRPGVTSRMKGHILRPQVTLIMNNNNNSHASHNNLVLTPLHAFHPRLAIHQVHRRRLHTLHAQGIRQLQHTNDNRELPHNHLTSNQVQGVAPLRRRQHIGLVVRGARIMPFHRLTRPLLLNRHGRLTSQVIQVTRRRHVTTDHRHTFSNIRVRRPFTLTNHFINSLGRFSFSRISTMRLQRTRRQRMHKHQRSRNVTNTSRLTRRSLMHFRRIQRRTSSIQVRIPTVITFLPTNTHLNRTTLPQFKGMARFTVITNTISNLLSTQHRTMIRFHSRHTSATKMTNPLIKASFNRVYNNNTVSNVNVGTKGGAVLLFRTFRRDHHPIAHITVPWHACSNYRVVTLYSYYRTITIEAIKGT